MAFLSHTGDVLTRTLDHWVAALDSYRRARRTMKKHGRPDVIIATAPAMETLIAGRALARKFSLPLVAEMRDAWPDLVAHTPGLASAAGPTSGAKRVVHELVTRLQRGADVVVTTTSTFAEVLRTRGIQPVVVLRNGTDRARYELIAPQASDAERPLRVLYIGTIGRSQGLDRVVVAVARLRAQGVQIEARLVGHGADVGRLRRLNTRLGSPVSIVGQVRGDEVLSHYQWADSNIVSLRDWEPFSWTVPSKLYELLATGKHITAVVAGEAADIVRRSRSGDVVAPGDTDALVAVWRSIANNRELLRVGAEGRRWVEQNADFDRIASEYLEVLARAIQSASLPTTT